MLCLYKGIAPGRRGDIAIANNMLINRSPVKAGFGLVLRLLSFVVFFLGIWQTGFGQALPTEGDTLLGGLRPERTGYDVHFYDLAVRVDPKHRSLSGSNRIRYVATMPIRRIQVDLFPELSVEEIVNDRGRRLRYERQEGAVFIQLRKELQMGEEGEVVIRYSGIPREAPNPPWEGGVTWAGTPDDPWVVVTCQGLGASVWWPHKDHASDEPDSMRIRVEVPRGLQNISNGRLVNHEPLSDGWDAWTWYVHHPINNYGVTFNVGRFEQFRDTLFRDDGSFLDLTYYVRPGNVDKARVQFQQSKPMLQCFEEHFGRYPFPQDGFKVVESPYAGMEHQSAIAYGNRYANGYRGRSTSEEGQWFDFILIHESAHEWFGNSVSSSDLADMWIHETFGTYMEAVYVECLYGYDAAMNYLEGKQREVLLDRPVVGVYGKQSSGSRDMYPKGALMLNTLRHIVANDTLWWNTLHDLATTYRHQIIDYETVTTFFDRRLGGSYAPFFAQYLKRVPLPTLRARRTKVDREWRVEVRWDVPDAAFLYPVRLAVGREPLLCQVSSSWTTLPKTYGKKPEILIDRNWYIDLQVE